MNISQSILFLVSSIFLAFGVHAEEAYTGSGFFITKTGYFVTNYHVIQGADNFWLRDVQGKVFKAIVVKVDINNDLALLKAEGATFNPLPIVNSRSLKRGSRVATVGFPNIDIQGKEPKLSEGIVSALSGLHDEPTVFQISIPIQPGNSGGPMVNMSGEVVGIVASKLSAVYMLKTKGSIPENVSYAIKANYLSELIQTEDKAAKALITPSKRQPKDLVELSERVEKAIALIVVVRKGVDIKELSVSCADGLKQAKYLEVLATCKEAALRGDTTSQMELARLYYNGIGIPQDYQETLRWSRLAAAQLDARGQHLLGVMYFAGKGVPQDYSEAKKWFHLDADQRFPGSLFFLGSMYSYGYGVPEDKIEGAKWYRLAAAQGDTASQALLGLAYHFGYGVPTDHVRGYMWSEISILNGGEKKTPGDIQRALRDRLSPDQISAAKRMAVDCILNAYKDCD